MSPDRDSGGLGARWRVVGASAVGSAHQTRGLPCQDAWAWRRLGAGGLILAVADGAGSASRSELGAATAVDAVIAAWQGGGRELEDAAGSPDSVQARGEAPALQVSPPPDWREQVIPFDRAGEPGQAAARSEAAASDAAGLDPAEGPLSVAADADHADDAEAGIDPASAEGASPARPSDPRSGPSGAPSAAPGSVLRLRAAISAARDALVTLAEDEGRPLRDYACTLTCLVAEGAGLRVAQVGDSVAVARDAEGRWHTVGRPQKEGEYANEAYFLTQDDALQRCVIEAYDFDPAALVASSDGLLRLMLQLPDMTPHAPFVEPLARFVAGVEAPEQAADKLAAFLDGPRVRSRTDDDTTLLIALRRPAGSMQDPSLERGQSHAPAAAPKVVPGSGR